MICGYTDFYKEKLSELVSESIMAEFAKNRCYNKFSMMYFYCKIFSSVIKIPA